MTFSCPPEFISLAHELADAAQPIIKHYYRSTGLAVDHKNSDQPVTKADREIERLMLNEIKTRFPDHGIWGEEYGRYNADAEWQWLLDPIDGTRAFSTGYPTFGILIALKHIQHGFMFGLCDIPATQDRWHGIKNGPVYMNDRNVSARSVTKIKNAIFACTDPLRLPTPTLAVLQKIRPQFSITNYGGNCLNYALLASGFVDATIETGQSIYDVAPFIPMIESGGGKITQLDGTPIDLNMGSSVLVACTAELHTDILTMLHT